MYVSGGSGERGGSDELLKRGEMSQSIVTKRISCFAFHAILQIDSTAVTYQTSVADQLASEPQERLLEVVVRLGRDVVVLQVLLAVEGDGLGLDLALLDVDLVAAQDDRDVLADADEIT